MFLVKINATLHEEALELSLFKMYCFSTRLFVVITCVIILGISAFCTSTEQKLLATISNLVMLFVAGKIYRLWQFFVHVDFDGDA